MEEKHENSASSTSGEPVEERIPLCVKMVPDCLAVKKEVDDTSGSGSLLYFYGFHVDCKCSETGKFKWILLYCWHLISY